MPLAGIDKNGEELRLEFTVEPSGRLGNLMFEYAAVLAICHNAVVLKMNATNNLSPDTFTETKSCLRIPNPSFNDPGVPLAELISLFNWTIPEIVKTFHQKSIYQEHPEDGNCIRFDKEVFLQPTGTKFTGKFELLISKLYLFDEYLFLNMCLLFLWIYLGYFQSWKYFHPQAESVIRRAFTFNSGVENSSVSFISSIRDRCRSSRCKLVGVQVRVGDKLNNNFYDQWSLRDLYFKKAMSLFIKKYEDFDLHFVFFVGTTVSLWLCKTIKIFDIDICFG